MKRRMSAGGRREQILDGAMRLFAQKGFRGTTTREIAQRLDISEALMFKYFPSKEALYQAIIRKKTDGSEEMLFPKEAIHAKDDRQVFQAIASYFIRKNTEDPTFMRLILYSSLEGHDLSNIFFENHAAERTRLLSKYIRQRIKESAFKKVPPMLAAQAFMGMVIHYVQTQEIHGMKATPRFSQKRVVSTLVDAFLNGLKGNQSALENERESLSQLQPAEANQRSIVLKEQNIRISKQVLRRSQHNLNLAEEEKKQIDLQEKNIELLKAKIQEAEAAFQLADIRFKETTIPSPIRGVISKRMADRGQMVQPGQPIFIVNDPGDKWVVANVEETKVSRVHPAAKATIEVDAFPGQTFEGRVEFIGAAAISEFALLPTENPSGTFIKITHRIPVRISVKDPTNRLRPGMMVVVAIEAKS